jgi:parallel beta-helix repeat protein
MKRPQRYILIGAVTLSTLVGSVMVGVSPAAAADIECGTVVTASTTLTHDLVDCPDNAILIDGSNIVLDLGGHTVDGQGVGIGVRIEGDGNTIKNGKVQQFSTGVKNTFATSGNTLTGLTATGNGVGMWILGGSSNRIVGNVVTGSGVGGIFVDPASIATLVKNNQVTGNTGNGIVLDGGNSVLTGNSVSKNAGSGLHVHGDGNVVSANQSFQNKTGMFVGADASNTTISLNSLSSNAIDGLTVADGSAATYIVSNTATKNADDGIDVGTGSATIKGNSAHFNGDHGIEATPVPTDGGGNRAFGNGSTNCIAVTCT